MHRDSIFTMDEFEIAKSAVFSYVVDLLVDMSDPPEDEEEDAYEDMEAVASVLFEGLDLTVINVEGNVFTVTLNVS